MNDNNIASSNIYHLKNKSNIKYRPYSSNISEKKGLIRVLSTGNIIKSNNIDIYNKNSFLPSLYNTKSKMIKIKKNVLSNSLPKKSSYKIELEKLYDQNVNYKKIILKLKTEINMVKNDIIKKQNILKSMNEEIEDIINENQNKFDFDIKESIKSDKNKHSLIKKMKNTIKEAEEELNNEIIKNKNLKKNIKFTKFNELQLESIIIKEQREKILILIENSQQLKNNQNKELYQNELNNNNLESQKKIISNFHQKFQKLTEEEKYLQKEIIKYENILNKTNDKVKIIKLKQISLQKQNIKLTKEKNDFNDKNKEKNENNKNNNYSLENLRKKLYKARNEFNYNKIKNQRTMEKLNNAKKNYNLSLEQYKIRDRETPRMDYDHLNNNEKNKSSINDEENINKLKQLYQENKDKENELEHQMFLFQDAIQRMNNGENIDIKEIRNNILKIIKKINPNYNYIFEEENNSIKNKDNIYNILVLSQNNPYCVEVEDNDPFISKKFTNEQFRQFTYVLFKNFEAKKINYGKAKTEIISPLMDYANSIINKDKDEDEDILKDTDIQEKLCVKFSEIILNLLNCSDKYDKNRIEIFFHAIYFDKMINSKEVNNSKNKINLITNYFLSLFNYIHEYNRKDEEILKQRINSNYITNFIKFKNLLKNYLESKNKIIENNEKTEPINYISIREIKNILEENPELRLKEKYIEFIIYRMKQFEDNKASLFDLKISKLDEIITDKENTQKNNNSKKDSETTESIEEVTPEEYNKHIYSVLIVVKQLMTDENKDIKELFNDSIVTINKPKTEIITLESFSDELNKRNINLNYLQISCINNKYCVNEELNALDINKIEEDINNLKENEINNYL